MIVRDDRTAEQMETHKLLVVMTDRCLSDWGEASGGASYAAWACKDTQGWAECLAWVKGRSDALHVRTAVEPYRPSSRHCAHLHVYVWGR